MEYQSRTHSIGLSHAKQKQKTRAQKQLTWHTDVRARHS